MKVTMKQMHDVANLIHTMRRFGIVQGRIDANYDPETGPELYIILEHVTEYSMWDPENNKEKIFRFKKKS